MGTKIFNLSLPHELVEIIDHQATLYFSSRSEYIKIAILNRLKSEGIQNANSKPHETTDEMLQAELDEFLAEQGLGPAPTAL